MELFIFIHARLYIVTEFADRVSAAPLAVAHLFDIFCAFVLHLSLHLLRGRGNVGKLVLGD